MADKEERMRTSEEEETEKMVTMISLHLCLHICLSLWTFLFWLSFPLSNVNLSWHVETLRICRWWRWSWLRGRRRRWLRGEKRWPGSRFLSRLQYVFVQIAKCICPISPLYLYKNIVFFSFLLSGWLGGEKGSLCDQLSHFLLLPQHKVLILIQN